MPSELAATDQQHRLQYLPIREFLRTYQPDTHCGSTWDDMFDDFAETHSDRLRVLLGSVMSHGFDQPVRVDGTAVRHGHSRVMIAWMLDRPVQFTVDSSPAT